MEIGNMITPKQFALFCYITLVTANETPHPSYLEEKSAMIDEGYDCFGRLDIHNMTKVIDYAGKWGIDLPDSVNDHYNLEYKAWQDLKAQGIDI